MYKFANILLAKTLKQLINSPKLTLAATRIQYTKNTLDKNHYALRRTNMAVAKVWSVLHIECTALCRVFLSSNTLLLNACF